MSFKVAILGAGPAGLAGALRFRELEFPQFHVFEQNKYPGGQAASFKDDQGFIWDLGGHVFFGQDLPIRAMIDRFQKDWCYHIRHSAIQIDSGRIPFPFQNNLHHLPKSVQWECLESLLFPEAPESYGKKDFQSWILKHFGKGIARHFLLPYNQKLWNHPLTAMSAEWTKNKISVPSPSEILKKTILCEDDTSFGLNARYKYPQTNGSGSVFKNMLTFLNPNVSLNHEVVRIDPLKRILYFKEGSPYTYDYLINTMPLDLFVQKLEGPFEKIQNAASGLLYNNIQVIGLGFRKKIQSPFCWVYYPEPSLPFFRVGQFSKFSPHNVPDPSSQSSLIFEISVKPEDFGKEGFPSLLNFIEKTGFIADFQPSDIISRFETYVERAYPVPTLDRDERLKTILYSLNQMNIHSVGRLGAWRYEQGSMEESMRQGVDAVNLILNHEKDKSSLWEKK